MPLTIEEDETITELEEFSPTRVDGVKSAANGFPILMLKSIDGEVAESEATLEDVLDELNKADAKKAPPCPLCHGAKTIKDGKVKCPKCRGTGVAPQVGMSEKELAEAAKASPIERGVAASGVPVPLPERCPTCKGAGVIDALAPEGGEATKCPDCGGSGKDSQYNVGHVEESDDRETHATDGRFTTAHADEGRITEGDPMHREKIDKSLTTDPCDDDDCDVCKEVFGDDLLEKKKLNAKRRNALPDSDFALPGRRYPIHDENHARNALARVSQHGTPEEKAKVRAAVHRRYPGIGQAEKSEGDETVAKDAMTSGPNPFVGTASADTCDDAIPNGPGPGSPAWEAVDAATATAAALALMEAAEHIRKFAERESIEIAAGEGNDVFDTYISYDALAGVSHALGIMAQMAFHEGLEAAKSLDESDESVAVKAGKRLSTKSVAALAAVRDHLSELLGDDDPAKSDDKGSDAARKFIESANKSILSKEIDEMTGEELIKLLDERDEARRAAENDAAEKGKSEMDETASVASAKRANAKAKTEDPEAEDEDLEDETDHEAGGRFGAEKGKSEMDEDASVASAKRANSKSKTKDPKADDEDLEDEATQGTDETASGTNQATGAAKAEADDADLAPEVIEAREAAKAAKKEAKRLRKAAEQAAADAATAKAVEEAVTKATEVANEAIAKATEAVNSLKQQLTEAEKATEERLATVEKMAAPSDVVRTRPTEALKQSAERDALEMQLVKYENMAKATSDLEYRSECTRRAKELRVQIAALNSEGKV